MENIKSELLSLLSNSVAEAPVLRGKVASVARSARCCDQIFT